MSIYDYIGRTGFIVPLGPGHKQAIRHDAGATGFAVYDALASNADWTKAPDALPCFIHTKAELTRAAGVSRRGLDDQLKKLKAHGWIDYIERPTGCDFTLRPERLFQAYCDHTTKGSKKTIRRAQFKHDDAVELVTAFLDIAPHADPEAQFDIACELLIEYGFGTVFQALRECGDKAFSLRYVGNHLRRNDAPSLPEDHSIPDEEFWAQAAR